MPDHRLGHAVGDEITERDMQDETRQGLGGAVFVLERKGSVEQVAEDAPEDIIGRRRNPITEMEHVVKHEHDTCSDHSIRGTHQKKFPEGAVKEFFRELFHGTPSRRYLPRCISAGP